jgi:hypothetical protein
LTLGPRLAWRLLVAVTPGRVRAEARSWRDATKVDEAMLAGMLAAIAEDGAAMVARSVHGPPGPRGLAPRATMVDDGLAA